MSVVESVCPETKLYVLDRMFEGEYNCWDNIVVSLKERAARWDRDFFDRCAKINR